MCYKTGQIINSQQLNMVMPGFSDAYIRLHILPEKPFGCDNYMREVPNTGYTEPLQALIIKGKCPPQPAFGKIRAQATIAGKKRGGSIQAGIRISLLDIGGIFVVYRKRSLKFHENST
jgi:hypothetical protein